MKNPTGPQMTPVPIDFVYAMWGKVSHFIKLATDTTGGRFTEKDVYDDIQRGIYVLWIVVDNDDIIGALTTRIAVYPNKRGMSLDWVGGSGLLELIPMFHHVLEQYARDHKCSYLEGHGRGGWSRKLRNYGWKADHIVYNMEL
tara:strand:+ start:1246 stop:1674 length:429 start_codon:yes stop_codon:yes gene_type:complete